MKTLEEQAIDFINQRLTNYGYEWRDFKRLSNYASKFRKLIYPSWIVKYAESKKNNRFFIDDNGNLEYIVGQSFNEEFINLLADIAEDNGRYKKRKWLY